MKRRLELAIIRRWEEERRCRHCGLSLAFERVNKVHCSNKCRQAEYRERRYDFVADRRRIRNGHEAHG
jgi:hypothetical protein